MYKLVLFFYLEAFIFPCFWILFLCSLNFGTCHFLRARTLYFSLLPLLVTGVKQQPAGTDSTGGPTCTASAPPHLDSQVAVGEPSLSPLTLPPGSRRKPFPFSMAFLESNFPESTLVFFFSVLNANPLSPVAIAFNYRQILISQQVKV